MELVIGTKKWSSWSLRPWLVLKRTGAPFTETVVALREHDTTEASIRAAGSPNGLVPVLKDEGTLIWDSLAICEYLADKFPDAKLWPTDITSRALARAAAAEMHAGFHSLRGECPMDLSPEPRGAVTLSDATHKDVRRVVELWNDLRSRSSGRGPFLLGDWSIADAFLHPGGDAVSNLWRAAFRLRRSGRGGPICGDPAGDGRVQGLGSGRLSTGGSISYSALRSKSAPAI